MRTLRSQAIVAQTILEKLMVRKVTKKSILLPTAEKVAPTAQVSGTLVQRLLEPTTWCGLLTVGSSLATGGLAGWLNAGTLPTLVAGVGLILAKERKE